MANEYALDPREVRLSAAEVRYLAAVVEEGRGDRAAGEYAEGVRTHPELRARVVGALERVGFARHYDGAPTRAGIVWHDAVFRRKGGQ